MNILITGGASGLGGAITKRLAKNKDNKVFFTYNNSIKKAKAIESEMENTVSLQCDFSNDSSINSLVNKLQELELDILIHNVYIGDFLKKHFHKIDSDDFLNDFKNNVLPVVKITQEVIKHFRKKKSGKIITVLTSALSGNPPIGSSVYIANKSYLKKLTEVWANENIKFNITSNSVSPSLMQTNLTSDMDERIIDQIRETHPLKEILKLEDVASTIDFLTTTSSHINGLDIVINAGLSIK